MDPKEGRVHCPKVAKTWSIQRLCWTWSPFPSSLFEQPLEILSRGSHQRLTVDPPQPPQAKTAHAMPVFADRANKGSTQTWRLRIALW
jgi:hypothetical protein